jgi:LysR family hydrogen peroxide-inducible transcriptional activator
VIYTIAPYLLPLLIPEMHRGSTPQMPLILEENYTKVLTERLRKGEIDAMLIATPVEDPGLVALPLYDEPFVAALPAEHPWRQRASVQTTDLESENMLLLGSGHCFRDQVLQACPALNRTARGGIAKTLESSSLETIRHMVASGVGITVLPCTATRFRDIDDDLLALRPFEKQPPFRTVSIAWRRSFPRPKAIEAVRRAVLAVDLGCVRKIAPGQS